MKRVGVIVILILVCIGYSYGQGWLSGYGYRKRITISGASGAGSGYQVLLKVGEGPGASGAHFHLEGHAENFPSSTDQSGDIRFTENDGVNLLYFWVEKVEGTSPNRVAYCWVRITNDLGTNQDIFCYYKNSSAPNVSNPDLTFVRVIDGGQPVRGSWHFDEGSGTIVYDQSGNGNIGNLVNGPMWISGRYGQALSFDGVNDYVFFNHKFHFHNSGDASLEFWAKRYDQNTHRCIFWTRGDSNDLNRYNIFAHNDATFGFDYRSPSGTLHLLVTGIPWTMADGWVHFVIVRVGNNLYKVYKNGIFSGSATDLSPDLPTSTQWMISGRSSFIVNGCVDEVRIYARALSDVEVLDLYNNYGYTTESYPGRVLVRKRVEPEPSFSSAGEEEVPIAIVVDWNNGNVQRIVLLDNVKLIFENGLPGGVYRLLIVQDEIGNRTVIFPSSVKWPKGVLMPNIPLGGRESIIFEFLFDGSNYFALDWRQYE